MKNHVKRMMIEKQDLVGKIKRAEKVVDNPPFDMDKHSLILLAEQIKYMQNYLNVLTKRIDYEIEKAR